MDIDLIMICLRETIPNAVGLGLKSPEYYNLSETTKIFNVFGGLTFYYVIIFFYYKMSDPGIQTAIPAIIPIVSEIENVIVTPIVPNIKNTEIYIELFNNMAHKLMLENNELILDIAIKEHIYVLDTITHLKKLDPTIGFNITTAANAFQENMIDAIKENKELYANLKNNDLVVKYIASVCRQGYLETKIPEFLGFKIN
jgi:hypothetical protein